MVLGGGDGGVEDCGIVEKLVKKRCLGVLTDKLTDRRTLLVIVESLSRLIVPTKDDHQQKILFALLPLP